ncbi:RNB domain-containing ribonuclease [Paenibacillus sp. JTLBN-2024]
MPRISGTTSKAEAPVHPRALQTLLEEIKDTKEQTVISTMMLRSMKQGKYDADMSAISASRRSSTPTSTSPIRRYPDLVIHRVIREVIENNNILPEKRQEYLASRMPEIAPAFFRAGARSRSKRNAMTDQLKKAEYMLDGVGEDSTASS